jgi:hypothetical protein
VAIEHLVDARIEGNPGLEGLLTEVLYEKSQGEGMAKVSSVVGSATANLST